MKINRFQQLKVFYGIALTLIALTLLSSSVLMQHAVRRNEGDARVINLSGRQRMLSQRLTKCVLASDHKCDDGERPKRLYEISESLIAWKAAHLGLQHGDEILGLPPRQNSAAITALFAEMEPFHANMVHALEQMIAQVKDGSSAPDAIHATAEVLLRNEPRFLELMDKITFQFDKEAKERIIELQRMERWGLCAGLLILVLEFLFVFRPSLSHMAEMMNALQRRNEEALSANEQVRENEFRLRTILRTAMDGFCRVDMQGCLLEVNESYCRMSGYGEQELIGRCISIMEALEQPAAIAGRIRKIKERGWDRFESVQRRKDGSLFDVEVCAQYQPMNGGSMFVFVKDISKRKRAEDALRSSECRFRAIIDASPVPFGLNDGEQNITFLNKAFVNTFGYDVADIPTLAHWWPKAYPDAEYREWVAEEWLKRMNKANGTGAAFDPMEVNISCKDGTQRIAMVSAVSLGEQSKDLHLVVLYDITKRKQEENALQESEATIRALLNAADESIHLLDLEGRVLVANQTTANRLGMDLSDLIGKRVYDFFPPDVADARQKIVEELFAAGLPSKKEDTRQGHIFETSFYPIKDTQGKFGRMAIFARDITERKRAEEMLRESEARYAELAEQSSTVAWEVDDQGLYTFVSKVSEAVLGYPPDELMGLKHFYDLHPESGREAFKVSALTIFAQKQPFKNFVNSIQTKDGRQVWVSTNGVPLLNMDGTLRGYRGSDTDITERKVMEEKLLRSQRIEAIGTLASGVAHDLNNILAPIILSAEMLHAAEDAETRASLINSIEECANRGASVVNQVLTFARGTKGDRTTLQLNRLVEEMENIARQTFPKNITITSSVPSDLWPVTGDPTQIHQVLLNLCINARDAMPEGGSLCLFAKSAEIDENFAAMVPDAKAGSYAMLAVSDTGMGIAREIVQKIFDPFFTTKEVGKGTGLGLSTVAGIVRSHGGFVTVESGVGRGTTFKVFLPRETLTAAEQERLSQTEIPQDRGEATILVVEDEAIIAKTLSMVLKNNGYKVLAAFDGNEALALYKEHAQEIDLVFTDVMMPGMDGVALSRALQEINPRVKILASTGQASEFRQDELYALGVDVILHKPYDVRNLLASLHDAIHADGA
jgi:PAS domain S-box-containing protein